ncbi:MmpS family transport accessory protein [Micromonospora sp. C28SCA-DRY-2]|uniref:MmpS family transport accessory protein n=1 Tax=Micromonospora sp. C28SCA-DRY-2 TaxID=3059522 RepID=UPI002674CA87|nr:MmpS family transport accessory protein [Micromonospora sp. C28SCA-DRY-2]MDO3702528.1 MmpS family transport accessory protein [Micromonospora sp. C28SCA-DRY-2]
MSETTPPTDPPSPRPAADPHPWAPLDPRPDPGYPAQPDPWIPATPLYATPPTPHAAPAEPAHIGGAVRRRRRGLVAAVLAGALVLAAGLGFGGYQLLRPDDRPRAAPTIDDLGAEVDGAEGPDASPAPGESPSASPAATPSQGPGRIRVVYEVTGRGAADILYHDANGAPIWLDEVRLPWRTSVRTDRLDLVMVQASKPDDAMWAVSCSVSVDGSAATTETAGRGAWRASCFGAA